MTPTFTENTLDQVVTTEKVAILLGISTATVRNWVKCGNLRSLDAKRQNIFHLSEIENVKEQIANGQLDKLSKRANKSKAEKTFIPEEYLGDEHGFQLLQDIIHFVQSNNIDTQVALLSLAMNILMKEEIMSPITSNNIGAGASLIFSRKQIGEEIKNWIGSIKNEQLFAKADLLLNCPTPKHRDVLGSVYQSLLLEGTKSKTGSYYTPRQIVDEIVQEYVQEGSRVLDPCCGTGQFLLSFSEKISDPTKIYGIDIDPTAIRIARLNLLTQYKDQDFSPNIVCKNTLFEIGNYDLFSLDDENIKNFDVIATNPPWGLHFSKQEIERLKTAYPELSSFESFSYFLKKSLDLLGKNGHLSFILPESILNVKTHQDIRSVLVNSSKIKKVAYLNRVFKNVFTPVIRLDLQKIPSKGRVQIVKDDGHYQIDQERWKNNESYVFDIHVNDYDSRIIEKVYQKPHQTLKNHAEWALGIVTGNNEKFLSDNMRDGYEPIYKGKDINKFSLGQPSSYIRFTPEQFQQVAPIERYRAKEKLVYKFISKNLVFAYDDKQQLTLNSANVVIPQIESYPIKVIVALFNSSLYQFLFQKKFSTIKVLRGHIEQLPVPDLDKSILDEISDLVDKQINKKLEPSTIDQYIMNLFDLSSEEAAYITNSNQ